QVKASALLGAQPVSAVSAAFTPVRGGTTTLADLVLGAEGRRALAPIHERHLAYEGSVQRGEKRLSNLYDWDFSTYYGNFQYGTNYAFYGAQHLQVAGYQYYTEAPALLRQNSRELTLQPTTLNG
ncbi:hypothetical protein, partial [Pseudomonas viridiflava]|uniref:hypothetical protein n=1 Tax=Pseudomonas viridiflava TaxID=33069 RepID=UPI0013DF31F0